MHDVQLKNHGWNVIINLINQFNLQLQPIKYQESTRYGMWLLYYSGKVDDIKKYEADLKARIHPQTKMFVEYGIVKIMSPKAKPTKLPLDDVLNSNWFKECPGKLKIAIGETYNGNLLVGALEKLMNTVIAGTPGSGKTNFLHVVIHSLIETNTPDDVKFVLIDFKTTEFARYRGISYLHKPIITDIKIAHKVIQELIAEMKQRYDKITENGYSDFDEYNENEDIKMPYIIIIIDEFATLTLRLKESETDLIELAQKARASGMFLILTVHKPTTDTLNSTVKAMMNTRIAFKVGSKSDSRVIIDQNGADELLGQGDMIIDTGNHTYAQACFVERQRIDELTIKHRTNEPIDEYTNTDDEYEEYNEEVYDDIDLSINENEEHENFYNAIMYCYEIGGVTKKSIYNAINKGETEQIRILNKAIMEEVVKKEKGKYGRHEFIMSKDEFIDKYKEV